MARKLNSQARNLAKAAALLAEDRHCSDIVILDLRGLSQVCDYFVIATGTSDRQMRSVADDVCRHAEDNGLVLFGQAGYETAGWILLDFIDVVVHLFDEQYRQYYDLDMLWGDAKKVRWQRSAKK